MRDARDVLIYMSVDDMFPDPRVRALAKAAGNGDTTVIDSLVSERVSVDARGTQGATPLFWALRAENIHGFEKLLNLGADPNVIFEDGGAVMHWAARMEDSAFLGAALKHGGNPDLVAGWDGRTPLFQAISSGPENRSMLIDHGANLDARGKNGDTAVMVAAGRGIFDVVYELLQRGADYRVANNDGATLVGRVADKRVLMGPDSEGAVWMHKVAKWLRDHGERVPGFEEQSF